MEAEDCSIVCQDRQGCLSPSWFRVKFSSAQCADILTFSSSGLYNAYSLFSTFIIHGFTQLQSVSKTSMSSFSKNGRHSIYPLNSLSYNHIRTVESLLNNDLLKKPPECRITQSLSYDVIIHFSHFLILLKSGNQY